MTPPDPRIPARLAAEWFIRAQGLDPYADESRLLASDTARLLPFINMLADCPDMQALCAWRRAMGLLDGISQEHC